MHEPLLTVFAKDTLIPDGLIDIARERKWESAVCSGIGGVCEVELAYFDRITKEYQSFWIPEIVELVSLNGNLTWLEDKPFWHLHALVADREGKTSGGHVLKCKVALTLELAIWPLSSRFERKHDEISGLNLIHA